ncbi:unnamed protein product [Linum trigynum]|uniref:Uncharacterized protein n=1 Tax=Linum trigynum TaxID=586398 RepID=A0AAV2FVM8_9ROSI
MHENQLQGDIPNFLPLPTSLPGMVGLSVAGLGTVILLPASIFYIDFAHNLFNATISTAIGNYITSIFSFSLSNNQLRGSIPPSICNAQFVSVIDLSNNELNDMIPSCLMDNRVFDVLNLRSNKLVGTIPDTFQPSLSLETLDLSGN